MQKILNDQKYRELVGTWKSINPFYYNCGINLKRNSQKILEEFNKLIQDKIVINIEEKIEYRYRLKKKLKEFKFENYDITPLSRNHLKIHSSLDFDCIIENGKLKIIEITENRLDETKIFKNANDLKSGIPTEETVFIRGRDSENEKNFEFEHSFLRGIENKSKFRLFKNQIFTNKNNEMEERRIELLRIEFNTLQDCELCDICDVFIKTQKDKCKFNFLFTGGKTYITDMLNLPEKIAEEKFEFMAENLKVFNKFKNENKICLNNESSNLLPF